MLLYYCKQDCGERAWVLLWICLISTSRHVNDNRSDLVLFRWKYWWKLKACSYLQLSFNSTKLFSSCQMAHIKRSIAATWHCLCFCVRRVEPSMVSITRKIFDHLYLRFLASTRSTGSQLRLSRMIAACSPMILTRGVVKLIGELNNCLVNR